jgi:hypothetical protein
MALLDRLIAPLENEEKLPIHEFMAALAEYKRGVVTKQNIITAFGLNTAEANALQDFLTNLDSSSINRSLIHDVLLLGEGGHYTKTQIKNRLNIN